jgi:hypothetical protein
MHFVAELNPLAPCGLSFRFCLRTCTVVLGLRGIDLESFRSAHIPPRPQTLGRSFEIEMIAEHDEGQHVATLGITSEAVESTRLQIHGKRSSALALVERTVSATPSARGPGEFSELPLVETFRRWKQFALKV